MNSRIIFVNTLTFLRVPLIFSWLVFAILEEYHPGFWVTFIAGASMFLSGVTDFFDGIIARKYNMITNFGKFLDPLADKFIVFAALLGILVKYDYIKKYFVWAAAIVMFRELAVTSMRLIVAGKKNIVIAASWLGKFKTLSQMVCIIAIILEPVVFPCFRDNHILSYVTMGIMTVMTLWSGIDYFAKYGKYITEED